MLKFKMLSTVALSTMLLLAGCGTANQTSGGAEKSDDGTITVGYVAKHLQDDFMNTLKSGAEDSAKDLDINLIFQAPEKVTDVEKQVQMVDDLIAKQVDAIVLSASGPVELIPSIKKANEANIPVVLVNDTINDKAVEKQGAKYEAYVGTDNYAGGKLAGEFVKQKFSQDGAKVAIIGGTPGIVAGDKRLSGFKDGIAGASNIKVVAEQPTDWSRDQGFSVMQNILTANPNVTLVYTAADQIALGALEAIKQAGKEGKIQVIGFDGSKEAQDLIKKGKLLADVAQYPDDMSKIALETVLKVKKGETVDKVIPTKVELLTKDNVK